MEISQAYTPVKMELKSTRTLGKAPTKYHANENATRIVNIPYKKYIKKMTAPTGCAIPSISEDFSPEENAEIINECISSLKIGGTVYIPSGEYKISTVTLKSDMTLFISENARLISMSYEENEKSTSPLFGGVIYAENCENITVTGGGKISGSGRSYTNEPKTSEPLFALCEFNLYTRIIEARKRIRFSKTKNRYSVLKFKSCKSIVVDSVILDESASWTLVIESCDNVMIKNTVIDNDMRVANTDGIDLCGGDGCVIENCFIATGDDAIVLKPIYNKISNVKISNCVMTTFANWFKIGTESPCDVENVKMQGCEFFLPDGITGGYSGIAIESADGANIDGVEISDIEMDGVSSPLLIWLGNRLKYDNKKVGSIKNISISNVTAVNTELPSAITGCKVGDEIYKIKNVKLENIKSVYRNTKEQLTVREKPSDISMDGYPEISRVSHYYFNSHEESEYWDLPCYSLFIRYAENIDYKGLKTIPRECSTLQELYIEK